MVFFILFYFIGLYVQSIELVCILDFKQTLLLLLPVWARYPHLGAGSLIYVDVNFDLVTSMDVLIFRKYCCA